MPHKCHVFRKHPDGHPLWVDTLPSFEDARAFVAQLAAKDAAEYAIFDVQESRFVLPFQESNL